MDAGKCKFDYGMPDFQVLTLLVSLGFDTMEKEKKDEGEREKSSTI